MIKNKILRYIFLFLIFFIGLSISMILSNFILDVFFYFLSNELLITIVPIKYFVGIGLMSLLLAAYYFFQSHE
ncbi:hypothetical protein EDC44_12820 [Cricetibacter osteomyelitidis]|uniref:Uncharacterized protein n=1 Tax=Cricetibacter osteomyelitidis TaxID=1521931 RepID=A0A4R2SPJ4_9PAST|nr:hypothetical protein EDC44_12820 [Cricetibacter osteomyelitidis]